MASAARGAAGPLRAMPMAPRQATASRSISGA
jgi:hypothetical protein